jgi:hypothetical protein
MAFLPYVHDASIRRSLIFIGVIAGIVVASALVWNTLNYSFFLGLLFDDAFEFARTGIIVSDFMPVGYSGLLGLFLKVFGLGGIPVSQAILYVGILLILLVFLVLRGVRGTLLVIGTAAVALHPVLILNIWRIHDGNLTALLRLGLLVAGIVVARNQSLPSILVLGVVLGLLFSVRQNALPLAFIVPLLFFHERPVRVMALFRKALVFAVGAAVCVIAVNTAFKGTPFFVGRQGPYNLFSGTNEYASKYLLSEYSGENSLKDALLARGVAAPSLEDRLYFPPERYTRFSLDYVIRHPLEYLKLIGLKVVTLLRPGYHMVEGFVWISPEGLKRMVKITLAAPFFIWLFLVFRTRKHFFDTENLFVVLVAAAYIVPFLAANADPRYRFPLDIILIADSFCRARTLFVPGWFRRCMDYSRI